MIQDINKQIYFNKQWKCYSAAKLSSLSMESETKTKWFTNIVRIQGRIQDFKLGGGALKKIAPSGGRREIFWGISCEKSRFYAKKLYCFQLRREARKFLGYFV